MPQEAAGRGKASRDSRDALHQQLPLKDLPKRPPAASSNRQINAHHQVQTAPGDFGSPVRKQQPTHHGEEGRKAGQPPG